MQESITIAEVGSIVKVSGSRIATPFGPPSPGSTPTKMPSTSPSIIRASVFHVSRTLKPYSRSSNASMGCLEAEQRFERSLRHDDVEGHLERHEHQHGEDECREQRLPGGDAPDPDHEAGDEQEARDVKAEPLQQQDERDRRHQHLHHAPQLYPTHEGVARRAPRRELLEDAVDARAGEDQRKIE